MESAKKPSIAKKLHHCNFCINHGSKNIRSNHQCEYYFCECEKCLLTREVHSAMKQQQRIWRYIKPRLENIQTKQLGSGFKGQVCDKCRNHGRLIAKKKHTCPYANCDCTPCSISSGRQRLMRYQQRLRRRDAPRQSVVQTRSVIVPAKDKMATTNSLEFKRDMISGVKADTASKTNASRKFDSKTSPAADPCPQVHRRDQIGEKNGLCLNLATPINANKPPQESDWLKPTKDDATTKTDKEMTNLCHSSLSKTPPEPRIGSPPPLIPLYPMDRIEGVGHPEAIPPSPPPLEPIYLHPVQEKVFHGEQFMHASRQQEANGRVEPDKPQQSTQDGEPIAFLNQNLQGKSRLINTRGATDDGIFTTGSTSPSQGVFFIENSDSFNRFIEKFGSNGIVFVVRPPTHDANSDI